MPATTDHQTGLLDHEAFGCCPRNFAPGAVVDSESAPVQEFVNAALSGTPRTNRSIAVALYYAVRDGIFYEIFGSYLGPRLSASVVVQERRGFCLHKAILYAAACRAARVPCRILAATVRNHVSSPSIQALVGGDIFLHWYNEVLLDGRWLTAAPIFNALTCKLYGIAPLEFDGHQPAVAQPYHSGTTLTFLSTPVRFVNPSRAELIDLIQRHHPKMTANGERIPRTQSPPKRAETIAMKPTKEAQ
jgi:transglutaminase-like putative cysteine protease